MAAIKHRSWRRLVFILSGLLLLFVGLIAFLAKVYVEPVLRKRLETLVVEGSDSLYTYQLGNLNVNFFGGNISVHNLAIKVDSSRYYLLKKNGNLPSLVMQLNVNNAHIKGIGIFSLLFGKKILINEISSANADIKLSRYARKKEDDEDTAVGEKVPLWKAVQPRIKDVQVNNIKLDGIKLLYKNEEGDEAKLQFDRCDAQFKNIRIDSVSLADTSRIGYVENFSFRLNDLKFRTSDSTYKMKAEWITYNSASRLLEVDSFKLQPTLKKDERIDSMRKSWYTVTLDKVSFMGLRLDRYLRLNRAEADSVIFQKPVLAVYQDKKGERSYSSKIGKYPHQLLVNAGAIINIKKFVANNMQIAITERDEETREEGTINLDSIHIAVSNIVNDKASIRKNPLSTAQASGKLIGSPIQANFTFYLDSAINGRFDASGKIGPVSAAQINPISTRLANIEVPTVQISSIDFAIRGQDYEATSNVQMVYDDLSIIFRKRNEETGANTTRKFLTKILNRYAINATNRGEMVAKEVRISRLTTQTFFGVIWKAVFEGMQRIMLKSGQIG